MSVFLDQITSHCLGGNPTFGIGWMFLDQISYENRVTVIGPNKVPKQLLETRLVVLHQITSTPTSDQLSLSLLRVYFLVI